MRKIMKNISFIVLFLILCGANAQQKEVQLSISGIHSIVCFQLTTISGFLILELFQ